MSIQRHPAKLLLLSAALICAPAAAIAQEPVSPPAMTYADIVDLADSAPLVLRAQIRQQATVERERSPGLAPGFVRLYVEARTTALIAGNAPVGEALRYLVDVPLDAKGKAPKLKKQEVILFARPVSGHPDQLQLVDPQAQFPYSEQFEARLSAVEVTPSPSVLLADLVGAVLPVPVAHGEGLVHWPDATQDADALVAMRFVDGNGAIASTYPQNPNGSIAGMTGFTSTDGRATIMMPHPERATRVVQMSWAPSTWSGASPWSQIFESAARALA